MITRRRFLQSSLAAAAMGALPNVTRGAATKQWPMFRGADARGVADGATFPDRWSPTQNVAWKTDIPGRGWSSPVVWGDRVFLTTVVNTAQSEAPKKGLYFGGERQTPKTEHEWRVLCLDLTSGEILWNQVAHKGRPQQSIHVKNSFASETPVTDGKCVYACFGNVGVYCFDMEGKPVWSFPIEPQKTRYGWGTASSPALHGDRLYIVNDNEQQSYLLALDAATGKQAWRTDREDEKSNWSTPYIWKHDDRTEIVTLGSVKIRSYDLDGKVIWSMNGTPGIAIAMPYSADGLLYVSSGYVGAPLKPIYAIKPGAIGDITLPQDKTSSPSIAWCDWKAGPYNPSTLVYGKRLYVLYDRGMLACHDAATGKIIFERQRIPGSGAGFTASPWAADGKIFCLNEDGVTSVFGDSDKFEPLHSNMLADDDMGMATPAVVEDRLLIRTMARVYCMKT